MQIGAPFTETAFSKRARSAATAFAWSSTVVWAHGLGAQPKGVLVWLKCKTAVGVYVVGDRILAPSYYDAGLRGISIEMVNATEVRVRTNASLDVPIGFLTTDWDLEIEAWT